MTRSLLDEVKESSFIVLSNLCRNNNNNIIGDVRVRVYSSEIWEHVNVCTKCMLNYMSKQGFILCVCALWVYHVC